MINPESTLFIRLPVSIDNLAIVSRALCEVYEGCVIVQEVGFLRIDLGRRRSQDGIVFDVNGDLFEKQELSMKSFMSFAELDWLKGCDPSFTDNNLSKKDSLNASEWEAVNTWVERRKANIANAPTLRVCAHLAKFEGVKIVNETILRNCSAFRKIWNDSHCEKIVETP